MYAQCFRLCRQEIHSRMGHRDDQVIVAAIGPWNVETGPWMAYFSTVLWELNPDSEHGAQVDGIALHVYSRGPDPASIVDDARMHPPFERWHSGFQVYGDFMEAVPTWARHLPVYITECNQNRPWDDRNTGWVQAAYAEMERWNRRPGTQPIRCLCVYRWDEHDRWHIRRKSGVIADMRAAIEHGYRWDRAAPSPEPEPSQAFTEEEAARCRDGLAGVPATVKASVERGYHWLKESFLAGDPYAFGLAYDPQSSRYVALKLETRRWQVVAELEL